MTDREQIRAVLIRNPEVTTIEEALDRCEKQGVKAGVWSVNFAALDLGRKLTRRPPAAFGEDDLCDLARTLLGLHQDLKETFATLDKLQEMNDAGTRIDWPTETKDTTYGWELSVAQELADYAGGIPQARQVFARL